MHDERDLLLMIPGPTNLAPRVREAMAHPQLGHTTPEFTEAFTEALDLSRYVFMNYDGLPFLLSGSGTIGMETSIVSLIEPGEKVLCLDTGLFGWRFADMANAHGAQVDVLQFGPGKSADPKAVDEKLSEGGYKAVTITHVDTSTTVANPIKELVKIARRHDVYSIVDSVCGVGGCELVFDELKADIAITCSQKALAGPPGAVLLAVSKRAMEAMEARKTPIQSYYMNLVRWRPVMEDTRIYLATPSVQIILALRETLLMVKEEGLENRWRRHRLAAEAIRAGLEAPGIGFLAEEGCRADTVTGFYSPHSSQIHKMMMERYRIQLAQGLGDLKGKALRIGHFGNINQKVVSTLLSALETSFHSVGVPIRARAMMEAAAPHLEKLGARGGT